MHNVGDIVYIISNKRRQIFPVQVVVQVIRKTLTGEEVTYKVRVPGREDGATPVDLHALDGSVHESLQKAKSFLYEQAASAIESMLRTAQEMALSLGHVDHLEDDEAPDQVMNGSSKLKVKLDDGTSATVTLPDVQ
jgi:hypothetical protein